MKATLTINIILFFICLNSAFAQGLNVVDCNGKTRATRNTSTLDGSNVEVDVIDVEGKVAKEGTLKLTNSSGKSILAQIEGGTGIFHAVSDGNWVLTSETNNLFYTTIAFSDQIPPAFFESVADTAIVVGSIIGGVVLYNIIKNSTDGSSGGSGDNGNTPPSNDGTCATCNPDLVAPSVPAF